MFIKIITSLILSVPFFLFAQPVKKMPLDGRTYITEILEDGKKKPLEPDDLKFNAGKFKSTLFADWSFTKSGKYEINSKDSTSSGKTYSWFAELVNESGEKLVWAGTANEEEIDGTIEYVNKKGAVKKTYTFTGKIKKKPGLKK